MDLNRHLLLHSKLTLKNKFMQLLSNELIIIDDRCGSAVLTY